MNTLDLVFNFIEQHCLKGVIAFEVGKRVFNLHIQGLFRVHYPKSKGMLICTTSIIFAYTKI